jgi:NAD(P)-dependent dehydrogenase (short-subunit alcohol dehydrogenase family)
VSSFEFDGKTVAITGAANGIGRAVAQLAIAAGARVALIDRVPIEPSEFSTEPGRVTTHLLDLTDVPAYDGLAAALEAEYGTIDALVHVAGVIIRRASMDEVSEADYDLQYGVNLKSCFFLVARLRRLIIDHGSIVLFTSQGWWTGGLGGSVPYASTKAGVVALVRGLSHELAPRGIRINAVAPGFVDTAMMREGLTEEARQRFVDAVPLGRFASPEEVADTALFLVSEASRYMTGATLNVTGGQLAY